MKHVKVLVLSILISIVLSAMDFPADAQDALKFSADISIGPSIPLGKFADRNYTAVPNSNGLAKTGFAIYANLRYEISNHIGLVMTAQSSFNKQDPESFSDYINHGANFPQKTNIVTDDWRIFKILMGLYYQGRFSNKKLSYIISILGGVCKTSVPSYYWAVYTPSGSLYNESQQNSVSLLWSFAYQAGGGLKYDLKNNIYLNFSADYFNASSQLTTSNLRYDFGSINLVAVVGIRF